MAKRNMEVDTGAAGPKVVTMDYPSNSHKKEQKVQTEVEKKVNKVVTGKVVKQKKSLMKKFTEVFIGDDIDSVGAYILYDVLIPAAKSTLSDMVGSGIEMLLFGETKGSRTKRDRNKSYVSYSSYYDRNDNRRKDDRQDDRSRRNRSMLNFDDIILDQRGEAEEVLSHLVDLTEDYGIATVADLYDLVGITSNFTDNKYGWTNLSSAQIIRVRNGYLLSLPKAGLLD